MEHKIILTKRILKVVQIRLLRIENYKYRKLCTYLFSLVSLYGTIAHFYTWVVHQNQKCITYILDSFV